MPNTPGMWDRLKTSVSNFFYSENDAVQIEGNSPREITIRTEAAGSSGISIFSGYYSEEYLSTLRGTQAADAYDKMRRSDARIKMVLSAVKNPIKGAKWDVSPASDDVLAVEQAELIEHMLFNDMEKSWGSFISEALSMVDFGFSVFEMTDKVVIDHPEYGSYVGIRSLGFRSQRTMYRFNLSRDTGELESITQLAYGDLERYVDIPGDFLLTFAIDKEGDNYEGISGLRPCFGPWSRKNVYLKLMAIGIEKSAVPTPVADVPEGKENSVQFTNMQQVLEKYTSHQSNYITKPKGWELTFLQNPFDAEKIKSAIDFENQEIVVSFLANFLLLGMNGSGGGYALSFDLSDFFLSGIEHIANAICEGINSQVIPRMIQLNYGPQAAYPKLVCSGISDKVGKEFSEMMRNLVASQVIIPDDRLEEEVRKRIGLGEMSLEGQRKIQPPAPAGMPSFQGSEKKKIKLAEYSHKIDQQIVAAADKLRPWMQSELKRGRGKAYVMALKTKLSEMAGLALDQAYSEVGKKKLSEISLAEVPVKTGKKLEKQAELIAGLQTDGIAKALASADEGVTDAEALDAYLNGPALTTGAVTIASEVINTARNDFFTDPAQSDVVESLTFANPDPVSEICQDLVGTTFTADDPNIDEYSPPLHHNCKSYLIPNLTANSDNPDLTPGGLQPSSPDLDKFVTISEGSPLF